MTLFTYCKPLHCLAEIQGNWRKLDEARTPVEILSCNITQANEGKYSRAAKVSQNDEMTPLDVLKLFKRFFVVKRS